MTDKNEQLQRMAELLQNGGDVGQIKLVLDPFWDVAEKIGFGRGVQHCMTLVETDRYAEKLGRDGEGQL